MGKTVKHRVGAKRIAKQAGVSIATVDRVLNERPGVSPATVQKVLDAVSFLNEENVTRLSGDRTPQRLRVAVVVQSGTGFNSRLETIVQDFDALALDGAEVELVPFFTTDYRSEPFIEQMMAARDDTDGMLLVSQDTPVIRDTVSQFTASGYPIVCITTDLPGSGRQGYVAMDQYRAGRVAGTLIGRFTCRQQGEVLFIVSGNYRCQQEREIGFRQVLRESWPNLTISESLQSADSNETSYAETKAFLESGRKPLAIYNVSGGNLGIVKALDECRSLPQRPVYICHELTTNVRRFLLEGKIDAVIDYDADQTLRLGLKQLIAACGVNGSQPGSDTLPIQICLADTV